MKYIKIKIVMALMAAALMFVQPLSVFAQDSNEINSILETVEIYMDSRSDVLLGKVASKLENIAVNGIVIDEEKHYELIHSNNNIADKHTYEMNSVQDMDNIVIVHLDELIKYGNRSRVIPHEIMLLKNEDSSYTVASDKYYDEENNFKSCSYLSTDDLVQATAIGSANCMTHIASSEVGYLEKASNSNLDNFTANAGSSDYTKYGSWYGLNGEPWCAIFVSWCAEQADIRTNIIPKTASSTTSMNTFKNWGNFEYSSAHGGNYKPKVGDIFFLGTSTSSSSHTGIVVSVSSTTITVVDGNYSNKVSRHTYKLTDSSLVGYGTPSYGANTHKWITSGGQTVCQICGTISYAVE